jgi:hypothetical protein
MKRQPSFQETVSPEGIQLRVASGPGAVDDVDRCHAWLHQLGLDDRFLVDRSPTRSRGMCWHLTPEALRALAPAHDTLSLDVHAADAQGDDADLALTREIVLALLASPTAFEFPSFDEFMSHVRVRRRIVEAARRTALAFDTEAAERPEDCWCYDEDSGFTLRPGHDLASALIKATQPDVTGRLYAFSCYRATEYVILLAIAQELAHCNPELLQTLTRQCERRVIRSAAFHDVFLHERGSLEAPVPLRYYVPGDRVWFRNPDEVSADVAGYEGSWVFYLGGGLFSNFWQRDAPYTLDRKCIEVYHWRHGVRQQPGQDPMMDETQVHTHVQRTEADPEMRERVLTLMRQPRAPRGHWHGGCLDLTREHPRELHPTSCGLRLPPLH